MLHNKKAFTLVELIIVIVILGILSTIGFIGYSSYLTGARDANRISQLKAIQEGLHTYRINHVLPKPDNAIDILIDSKKVATQGYAGESVLETIRHSTDGVDPKDKTYYSYYLAKNGRYFQLMAFLEEEPKNIVVFNNQVNALDYSKRIPYTLGDNIGILTDGDNKPIQEVEFTQIDIKSDLNSLLKSHFRGSEYVTGTGSKYIEFEKLLKIDKVGGKFWEVKDNKFCEIGNECI